MSNTATINLRTDAITTTEILLVVPYEDWFATGIYMGAQNRPNTVLRAIYIVEILVLLRLYLSVHSAVMTTFLSAKLLIIGPRLQIIFDNATPILLLYARGLRPGRGYIHQGTSVERPSKDFNFQRAKRS